MNQWKRLWSVAAAVGLLGCDRPDDIAAEAVDAAEREPFEVIVHEPASLTSIGQKVVRDHQGRAVGVGCMTCHSLRDEHRVPDSPDALRTVHAGLKVSHGSLSCRSCHDPDRADRLRLADGKSIEMVEAIKLCAQCHGPQARDWEKGSHGGTRGHWDQNKGPALRSHCVDCHDPHTPRFGSLQPAPPPRDRFLDTESHGGAEGDDE